MWPNDQHRVTISAREDGDSDYINASFVDSLWQKKAYIMAQGPIAATVGDFWSMIWEQRVTVIVMVTQLREKEREKCFQYWPLVLGGEGETFGMVHVRLISESLVPDSGDKVVERVLEAKCQGETRVIRHFQLIEWVDHGVPASFAPFRRLVYSADAAWDGQSPMLVHCSAGIGRSGVFVCAHSIWKNIIMSPRPLRESLPFAPGGRQNESLAAAAVPSHLSSSQDSIASAAVSSSSAGSSFNLDDAFDDSRCVNVFFCASQLRQYRPGAVQTPEQYEFIYRAIADLFEDSFRDQSL